MSFRVPPLSGRRLRERSPFGPRRHPVTGLDHEHTGADYEAVVGDVVVAVGSAVVERVDVDGIGKGALNGNAVWLRLDTGAAVVYAHLSAVFCKVGDKVAVGQCIGLAGASGRVTGPHLHFEVHEPGRGPVDPSGYLAPFLVR